MTHHADEPPKKPQWLSKEWGPLQTSDGQIILTFHKKKKQT